MRFEFHSEALEEFEVAATFYEDRQVGLGLEFVSCVDSTLSRISDDPTRWRVLEGDVRRCLVHVFPYAVLYCIEADFVLILAVMHCSREPGYWRQRISGKPRSGG